MAAPQVANLAGKLLARDPSLSVDQLVALIKAGADHSPEGRIRLIRPRRTMAMLDARLAH
jgi:subtilisin family serine protease